MSGKFCIRSACPGITRTRCRDHERFEQVYFSALPGHYFTGEEHCKDEKRDYWLSGGLHDALKASSHRFLMVAAESARVTHPAVAETSAVGFPTR